MILKSYAKINLTLKVIGKLANNYHLLDSLISYINLFDVIEIVENKLGKHHIIGNSDIILADNLILKVMLKFQHYYNITKPKFFTIKHQKNIPIGAGLGGGSSNAAVILNYLYSYYNIDESLDKKINFAKDLGADIPFFLTNHSKYISGIGEILGNNCNFPNLPVLLVKPVMPLATQDVFSVFKRDIDEKIEYEHDSEFNDINSFFEYILLLGNDLIAVSQQLCPDIKKILKVSNYGIDYIASMSGSGSTCFFLFKTEEDCALMKQKLIRIFPNFFIYNTILLNQC